MFSLSFLKNYLYTIIFGIFTIVKRFFIYSLQLWGQISIRDRFLFIFLLASSLFLAGGWRSYHIIFNADYIYSHTITTDDLVSFAILKGLLVLSILLMNFFCKYRLGVFIRFVSITGLFILYVITYMYPERITPNPETKFTWQFYSYGVLLIFVMISGFLGMINHTQKVRRKEIAF